MAFYVIHTGRNQFTAFPLCAMKECELKIGWNPKENRKGRLARLSRASQGISLESPFALRVRCQPCREGQETG